MAGASLAEMLKDDRSDRARNQARSLSLRIAERFEEKAKRNVTGNHQVKEQRAPAATSGETSVGLDAEGDIGLDPWGKPFHYRTIVNPKSNSTVLIYVWSGGANGQLESRSETGPDGTSQFKFVGDDLGFVKEVVAF